MTSSSLLTAEQSAEIAGVSLDTIQRYKDFGLLTTVEQDQQTFFRKIDIVTLFHREGVDLQPTQEDSTPETSPEPTEPLNQQIEVMGTADQEQSELEEDDATAERIINEQPVAAEATTAAIAKPLSDNDSELHAENLRLKEQVQTLEHQIVLIKEDRDWLRGRLEKFELRSEREQMLLLSERENIRSLVNQIQKRRSFWSFALPWFGETENSK